MGACITALDCMLKLSSSENALKVDLEYNHEMQVGGAATILSALLWGRQAAERHRVAWSTLLLFRIRLRVNSKFFRFFQILKRF